MTVRTDTLALRRSEPARNLHRYYRLSVQPTLFGGWCCQREWGRIGSPGQIRNAIFPTEAEARARFDALVRAKRARGYVPATGRAPTQQSMDGIR